MSVLHEASAGYPRLPLTRDEAPPPTHMLISVDGARMRIGDRIERVAGRVRRPLLFSRRSEAGFHLLTIGDGEFGEILSDERMHQRVTALLERENLERVGLEVMLKFGLDRDRFIILNSRYLRDGSFREYRRHPSGLLRGLDFEVELISSTTGKLPQSMWYVVDNAPLINLIPNRKPAA